MNQKNQLARLQSQIQPGSLLAKVLNDLSPEDLAALRKKAAEGKLAQDLASDERFQKLQLSAAEIELFTRHVQNLQQTVGLDPRARYNAQGQYEGATGTTRIEVKKGCMTSILLLASATITLPIASAVLTHVGTQRMRNHAGTTPLAAEHAPIHQRSNVTRARTFWADDRRQ